MTLPALIESILEDIFEDKVKDAIIELWHRLCDVANSDNAIDFGVTSVTFKHEGLPLYIFILPEGTDHTQVMYRVYDKKLTFMHGLDPSSRIEIGRAHV